MCSSCKSDGNQKPVTGCTCHEGAAIVPPECECKLDGPYCPACQHYSHDPIVELTDAQPES